MLTYSGANTEDYENSGCQHLQHNHSLMLGRQSGTFVHVNDLQMAEKLHVTAKVQAADT